MSPHRGGGISKKRHANKFLDYSKFTVESVLPFCGFLAVVNVPGTQSAVQVWRRNR